MRSSSNSTGRNLEKCSNRDGNGNSTSYLGTYGSYNSSSNNGSSSRIRSGINVNIRYDSNKCSSSRSKCNCPRKLVVVENIMVPVVLVIVTVVA